MEGFSVPVHRALTQPIMLGGAPREFAILNGTLGAKGKPVPEKKTCTSHD
jgi:type IV secretory pathway TrbD component